MFFDGQQEVKDSQLSSNSLVKEIFAYTFAHVTYLRFWCSINYRFLFKTITNRLSCFQDFQLSLNSNQKNLFLSVKKKVYLTSRDSVNWTTKSFSFWAHWYLFELITTSISWWKHMMSCYLQYLLKIRSFWKECMTREFLKASQPALTLELDNARLQWPSSPCLSIDYSTLRQLICYRLLHIWLGWDGTLQIMCAHISPDCVTAFTGSLLGMTTSFVYGSSPYQIPVHS